MALFAYNSLNLGTLGPKCDLPVTRACLSMLLSGKSYRSVKAMSPMGKQATEAMVKAQPSQLCIFIL